MNLIEAVQKGIEKFPAFCREQFFVVGQIGVPEACVMGCALAALPKRAESTAREIAQMSSSDAELIDEWPWLGKVFVVQMVCDLPVIDSESDQEWKCEHADSTLLEFGYHLNDVHGWDRLDTALRLVEMAEKAGLLDEEKGSAL